MGQCVLRDCGLEHPPPSEHLSSYLKKHLQEAYFESFIKKSTEDKENKETIEKLNIPLKSTDFNSSLEYKPKGYNIKPKLKTSDIDIDKKSTAGTKKIMSLIHKDHEDIDAIKFNNQNYKPPASSVELAYEEDLLGGSLEMLNDETKKNYNKSRFFESVKPNDQSISNMFQNQFFENVNTTPSGLNYRSDDENLGEYEKIFQDDEFNESYEEDYIKKLKKEEGF